MTVLKSKTRCVKGKILNVTFVYVIVKTIFCDGEREKTIVIKIYWNHFLVY